jgi:autotransporter-associated beta strand protein
VNAREIFNGEGRATVVFNHSSPFYSFAPKFTGLKTVNGFLNIQHTGTGTTVLTAPESNLAGTITVSAGTLVVNGNIKGSVREVLIDEQIVLEKNIGETSVLAGGTLGGTGFIEGKTTISGVLSPGVGAGVLKFGGDLSLESAGKVRIELGGILRGTLFDGIDVEGVLAYGGTLEIVLTNGFLPDEGDTFDLFDGFESQTGDFLSILFSAEDYAGVFDPVTGVLTVVPEPGTIGLLICAAIQLTMRRRITTSRKFKE